MVSHHAPVQMLTEVDDDDDDSSVSGFITAEFYHI